MVIQPILNALTHISCIMMCSLKSLTAVLGRGTPTNCEVLVSWLGACALWWGWSHPLIMMRCRTPGSWPGAMRNVVCCCCSLRSELEAVALHQKTSFLRISTSTFVNIAFGYIKHPEQRHFLHLLLCHSY